MIRKSIILLPYLCSWHKAVVYDKKSVVLNSETARFKAIQCNVLFFT